MRKITSLEELEVGMVIYLHNTTINLVEKVLIMEELQDNVSYNFGIYWNCITCPVIDLNYPSRITRFCPEDYNIIPNTYNTHFATFDLSE